MKWLEDLVANIGKGYSKPVLKKGALGSCTSHASYVLRFTLMMQLIRSASKDPVEPTKDLAALPDWETKFGFRFAELDAMLAELS